MIEAKIAFLLSAISLIISVCVFYRSINAEKHLYKTMLQCVKAIKSYFEQQEN